MLQTVFAAGVSYWMRRESHHRPGPWMRAVPSLARVMAPAAELASVSGTAM
jgi:hypothetical protein